MEDNLFMLIGVAAVAIIGVAIYIYRSYYTPWVLPGTLKLYILEGRNLSAKDSKTSDPYVVVSLGNFRGQTETKQATLNPKWNSAYEIGITQEHAKKKLCFQIFDQDMFKDDEMGRVEVPISQILMGLAQEPELFVVGGKGKGQLLLQFIYREEDRVSSTGFKKTQ